MLVKELVNTQRFTLFCGEGIEEIGSVYSCDLLSNALVRLKKGAVWLTVMNNINVSAVAFKNNVACVVLTEGVYPDDAMLESAVTHNVTILGSTHDTYQTSVLLNRILKGFLI